MAAFTASWTAVAVGGYNLVDYLLAAATLAAAVSWAARRRPLFIEWWMLAPFVASIVIGVADSMFDGGAFGFVDIIRVLLSTALLAILLTSVAAVDGAVRLLQVLKWWSAGVVVNALGSIAVGLGVANFNDVLSQPTGERLSGLSSHPNSIAFSITLSLPILTFLLFSARARVLERVGWLIALCVAVWGLALSDSRAGWIVALPALAISVVLAIRTSRGRALTIPIVIFGAILIWSSLPGLLQGTRVVEGSAESDAGRMGFNDQALNIFLSDPFFGGGFDDQIGVAVPLMVLSAGGLVLAVGYYLFMLWPTPTLLWARSLPIAQTGLVVLLVFAAFGMLNPVFVERATFWPILIPTLYALSLVEPSSGKNPWDARKGRRKDFRRADRATTV